MNNKKIYIVLTRTNTIPSKLIRLITKDTYSHVSISYNKKCDHMFSFGRKYKYFPLIGQFNIENIRKGFFNRKNTSMAIYELNITNEQMDNIEKIINFIQKTSTGYNIIGLILALFKIKLHRNKYYCSEFVFEVLSNEKVNIYDKNNVIFKPEQLVSDKFNKIYEGKIIDYVNS